MQAQRISRSADLCHALACHRQPALGIDRAGNQFAQAITLNLEQAQGLHLQQARALPGIQLHQIDISTATAACHLLQPRHIAAGRSVHHKHGRGCICICGRLHPIVQHAIGKQQRHIGAGSWLQGSD